MRSLDRTWLTDICAWCDPVFERADVGFERQVMFEPPTSELVSAILWEADPPRFAERFPDSGIVDSYGDGWDGAHCIDFWVNVDQQDRRARVSVEGWSLPEVELPLRGDDFDGGSLASLFARILGLPPIYEWHEKCL